MEYEWSYSFLSIRLVGQSDWVEAELASADAVLSVGTLYIEWWMTPHNWLWLYGYLPPICCFV